MPASPLISELAMFTPHVFLNGMGLGASLIMAIGAQNAHVLRVGVRRQHVAITVATCILVDVVLIGAGVAGMGALIQGSPLLMGVAARRSMRCSDEAPAADGVMASVLSICIGAFKRKTRRSGLKGNQGERAGERAWNNHRHLEAYYAVSGSGM
eukprot:gene28590-32291_t